jgi:hypothetical protein
MSNDQMPREPAAATDQISEEQRQREIEQTEAIYRRFKNWAKRARPVDLLRLTKQDTRSDTSQSKSDTTLDTSGEQSIDGESH